MRWVAGLLRLPSAGVGAVGVVQHPALSAAMCSHQPSPQHLILCRHLAPAGLPCFARRCGCGWRRPAFSSWTPPKAPPGSRARGCTLQRRRTRLQRRQLPCEPAARERWALGGAERRQAAPCGRLLDVTSLLIRVAHRHRHAARNWQAAEPLGARQGSRGGAAARQHGQELYSTQAPRSRPVCRG